jgi:hypothetical protein
MINFQPKSNYQYNLSLYVRKWQSDSVDTWYTLYGATSTFTDVILRFPQVNSDGLFNV